MSWDEKSFIEKLEGSHDFPGSYTFKFIVKSDLQPMVESLLPDAEIRRKPSSGNKYISISLTQVMESSDHVVAVYRDAYEIEGIIAL